MMGQNCLMPVAIMQSNGGFWNDFLQSESNDRTEN